MPTLAGSPDAKIDAGANRLGRFSIAEILAELQRRPRPKGD